MSNSFRYVIGSLILASVTAGLLTIVQAKLTSSDLAPILVILSGMTATAALSLLISYLHRDIAISPIMSDVNLLDITISRALPASVVTEKKSQYPYPVPEWDLTSESLVGVDNELALAKLRIDLEKGLRRLSTLVGEPVGDRAVGIKRLADDLRRKGILPDTIVYPLAEIAGICDRAVHGTPVSDKVARSVVEAGEELLGLFRTIEESLGARL